MATAQAAELKALGQVVRELREARNQKPSEISARSGLGADTLTRIELGTHDVTMLDLIALSDALGTTTEALLARAKL